MRPSLRVAQVPRASEARCTTQPRPGTGCGVERPLIFTPAPSSPAEFVPQHHTCPAVVVAHPCCLPSASWRASLICTLTGRGTTAAVLPSPSCPRSSLPQQRTPPEVVRTQEKLS